MLLTRINPVAKRIATPALGSVRTLVNKATIIGRVGQDAELNNVADKTVVHFSVATSENYKDQEGNLVKTTHWHRIVSWDQKKNVYLSERVKKGDLVFVEGNIHYKSYTAKDGSEKHLTEIALNSPAPKDYIRSGAMYQAFRGPDGRLEHLEVICHIQSNQNVVFMDDIESLFPGFTALRKGPVTVTKARDADYKHIDPPCIKYQPDIVLEVVVPSVTESVDIPSVVPPSSGKIANASKDSSLNQSILPGLETLALHKNTLAASAAPTAADVSTLTEDKVEPLEPSSPLPHRLLQRTQSMLQDSSTQLQVYEQTVRAGHLPQAGAIMEGIEALQQELQGNFSRLHSEMTKNGVLQSQILDMQKAAGVMSERMLELQQRTIQMQQQALDRLALIQNKVAAIMTQTYELHEYSIPRLFIVLPKEEDSTVTEKLGKSFRNVFVKQFKLYFLCECGDHTRPAEAVNKLGAKHSSADNTIGGIGHAGGTLKHEIHVARHEGYDLDHPTEFFEKYGVYVLTLLQMLKYGVTIAGVVVPPLAHLSLGDGVDAVQKGADSLVTDMGIRVNHAIEYLQGLSSVPEQQSTEKDGDRAMSDQLGGLEALEGADLRQLHTFLKNADDAQVFGNLYRTVTSDGHVKWVCLDHYRQNYRSKTIMEFRDVVESNEGHYDEHTGHVTIKLASSITARQFFSALSHSRFVNVLDITLLWETTFQDLRDLKDAILHSNVVHLKLTGGGGQGPLSDILNRARRSDPIVQLMAAGKIRALSLYDNDGFLERISKIPTHLYIRMLDFGLSKVSTKELKRLAILVPASPLLSLLVLKVVDLDEAAEIIQNAVESSKHAAALTLKLAKDDDHWASLHFRPHTGSILSIELTAARLQDTRLFLQPAVHSLSIKTRRPIARTKELVQAALGRYTNLHSVELSCEPYHFYELLDFIRKATASQYPSLQHVHLHHDSDNQLTTTNLQDPSATSVKLGTISTAGPTDSWDGVNSLFQHFGSEIQGLDLDMCLSHTQTERLLQSMNQAQYSKLRQVTWKVREPINPRIFPTMAQILNLSDPTSSSFSSASSKLTTPSAWKFTMILDMNRNSDIQLNSNSTKTTSLFDNEMAQEAMSTMFKYRVTRLVLNNVDLNKFVTSLLTVGCQRPFEQLEELTIDSRKLYGHDQVRPNDQTSKSWLELHVIEWIGSLLQRLQSHNVLSSNSSTTTPKINKRVAVTSVTLRGLNISPQNWKTLFHSFDVLTLRSITITDSPTFGPSTLSDFLHHCIATVNETKAIELLRRMDPVSNLTPEEERAVADLKAQEGHGVSGKEGPMRVFVRACVMVREDTLREAQKEVAEGGVWWCRLD
ncbi:hypothetical protein EC991_003785 [Linnemannia zychae]|nr:hypothetical protein EC991_003785 [Linnemannia zychae]